MAPALPALSADQQAAWAAAAALLRGSGVDLDAGSAEEAEPDRPRTVLAVTGRAGSGKSLLLAALTGALREAGVAAVSPDWAFRKRERRSFAVLAPTNKAASVLRARGVPATTIHRILYTPVYDPAFERVARWLAGEGDRPEAGPLTGAQLDRARASFDGHGSIPAALAAAGLRGSDFITGWTRREDPLDIGLVDEASMLDARALDDLQAIFPTLLLFGDPAQLPPVQGQGGMVFEALPPAQRRDLTRVHRQEADSPILDLSEALWDPALGFEDFEDLLRGAAARDPRVQVTGRADADLMARSPMLVWRNATRIRLIHAWRLHVVGAEEPQVSAASIVRIEREGEEEPFIPYAAQMGATFLHGAAVTIHKAQGSQWDTVQVFAPDLYAAARSGRAEAGQPLWKRLAYVAITRAARDLRWVVASRLARPAAPLSVEDLGGTPGALALEAEE